MIRVLIVDDQNLIREGLQMLLSLCHDIEVIGEAANGKEALQIVETKRPDIVLMDIRMPIMDGVEATKLINEKYPDVKVIILTTFNEDEYIFEGLKNGAKGYILKDVKSDEVIKGIKTVYEGNVLLQPEIATKVVKVFNSINRDREMDIMEGKVEKLTPRETEIAKLVAKGLSNKDISKKLFITEGTVKNHITRILGKLELRDRTQLAIYIKEKIKY